MAEDNNQGFKFNLDAKDAVNSVLDLKEKILALGESKNFEGIISGFTQLALPVAAVGTAIFAVKKSLDFAIEGEQIQKVSTQFDTMADIAGVSSETIKAGIESATRGTVGMTEAMKAATQEMAMLGPRAAQIPELFDLARRNVQVFGGDTVSTFQTIAQAIATGNERQLKTIGLFMKNDEVMINYAKSVNKTVAELSAAEQQQARLNAILEIGDKRFTDSTTTGNGLGKSIIQLNVVIKELQEQFSVFVSKNFAGTFASMATYLKDMLKFGNQESSVNVAARDLGDMQARILKLQYTIPQLTEEYEKMGTVSRAIFGEGRLSVIRDMSKELIDLQGKMAAAGATATANVPGAEAEGAPEKTGGKTPEQTAAERAKQAQIEAAFQDRLLKLSEARIQSELTVETDAEAYREKLHEQREAIEERFEAQEEELRSKAARQDGVTMEQANQLIEQMEAEKTAKIEDLTRQEEDAVLKSYANRAKAAKTASEGMAAGFAEGAAKAKRASQDFGLQGQKTFDSVKNNSIAAFKAMGDGSKTAGEAMKGFLLNSVADYFEMKGEAMLLEGLWPPNPLAIAGGGGLIALSAAMRSAAGGSSSSAGGGGGGGAIGGGPSTASTQPLAAPTAAPQTKAVTLQIMGDYFETEQTKSRLVDLIRQNADATAFNVQQIGVTT